MTDQRQPHTGPVASKNGVPAKPIPGLYGSLAGTVTVLDPDALTAPIGDWPEVQDASDMYGQYGEVAIRATEYARDGESPQDAWSKAARKTMDALSSIEKGCPKDAFLGLCEDGKVNGVREGDYTGSRKNKAYAIIAYEMLFEGFFQGKTELWEEVQERYRDREKDEPAKRHNGQLDVVLGLWAENLLAGPK